MVKKVAFWLIKFGLLGLALFFLYQKVSLLDLTNIQWTWSSSTGLYLFIFILLWLFNLSLDAIAWKTVQSNLENISFKKALNHNLKCYGLAFISPLNSGEIAGRYLIQEKEEHRKKALFLTFWTHIPKLFSKAFVSLPIIGYFLIKNNEATISLVLITLLFTVLAWIYLRLEGIVSLLHQKHFLKRPLRDYVIKGKPSLRDKLLLLNINGIRFLIFSSQLAITLLAFKPEILTWELYWSIPLFYFLSALLPSYTGLDFLIKGTLALYFFELFEADALSFTLASTAVWLFNWAVPALTGLSLLKPHELKRLKRRKV